LNCQTWINNYQFLKDESSIDKKNLPAITALRRVYLGFYRIK
jgi:hypothetical protein